MLTNPVQTRNIRISPGLHGEWLYYGSVKVDRRFTQWNGAFNDKLDEESKYSDASWVAFWVCRVWDVGHIEFFGTNYCKQL